MNTESSEEMRDATTDEKSRWYDIVKQWDELTPFAKIPMYTRAHALKMIAKLDAK